jgi:hypothetical protein
MFKSNHNQQAHEMATRATGINHHRNIIHCRRSGGEACHITIIMTHTLPPLGPIEEDLCLGSLLRNADVHHLGASCRRTAKSLPVDHVNNCEFCHLGYQLLRCDQQYRSDGAN